MAKSKKSSKNFYFHILLIIFLTFIILIPESNVFSQSVNNESSDEIKDNIEVNVNEQVGNITTGLTGAGKGIDDTLEKELVIPEGLGLFARVIFGIKEVITLQMFLIYLFVWLLLFLIISQSVNFMPGFNDGGIKSYAVGFIVTCLASISGGIKFGADFFFGFSEIFKFLEGMNTLKLVLSIVVILFLFFFVSLILRYFKHKMIIETADVAGTQAAAGIKIAKNMYKAASED